MNNLNEIEKLKIKEIQTKQKKKNEINMSEQFGLNKLKPLNEDISSKNIISDIDLKI